MAKKIILNKTTNVSSNPFIPRYIYIYIRLIVIYKRLFNKRLNNSSVHINKKSLIIIEQGEFIIITERKLKNRYVGTTMVISCVIFIFNGFNKRGESIVGMAHVDSVTDHTKIFEFMSLVDVSVFTSVFIYHRQSLTKDMIFTISRLKDFFLNIQIINGLYPSLYYNHHKMSIIQGYFYEPFKRFSFDSKFNRPISNDLYALVPFKNVNLKLDHMNYSDCKLVLSEITQSIKDLTIISKHTLEEKYLFLMLLDSYVCIYIKLKRKLFSLKKKV